MGSCPPEHPSSAANNTDICEDTKRLVTQDWRTDKASLPEPYNRICQPWSAGVKSLPSVKCKQHSEINYLRYGLRMKGSYGRVTQNPFANTELLLWNDRNGNLNSKN